MSFEDVQCVLENQHLMETKNDDPEQFIAVGFVKTILVTVVFEFREDYEGEFIWLVTYWRATKQEAKRYEKFRK